MNPTLPKKGQLFHTEMRSEAPSKTKAFLSQVFGWVLQDTPHPDYKLFETPGGFEGHIGPVPAEDKQPSATNYILVDDIEAAEHSVTEGGGEILAPRGEAPGQGYYTYFKEPGGIQMVLWQNINGQK